MINLTHHTQRTLQPTLYQQGKQRNLLEYPLVLFANGLMKVKSDIIKRHRDKTNSIEKACLNLLVAYLLQYKRKNLLGQRTSFMLELVPKSKIQISKTKWNNSSQDTLTIQLLQMLGLELTSKERDLRPFWDQSCNIKSSQLSLLTKTDYAALGMTLQNGSLNITEQNSSYWMKKLTCTIPPNRNLQKTFSVLSTSTLANKWASDDTEREIKTSRKIRLLPTTEQKKILNEWFGCCRYVYNRALNHINEIDAPYNKQLIEELRTKFVTLNKRYRDCSCCGERQPSKTIKFICSSCKAESVSAKSQNLLNPDLQDWELKVPKDIRDRSLSDLTKSYKTCFGQMKSGLITRFRHQFRKRKDLKSMEIGKENIYLNTKDKTISFFKEKGLTVLYGKKTQLNDDSNLPSDARISFDGVRYWLSYVNVTKGNLRPSPVSVNASKIVSLDPGARKFMTFFSEEQTGVFHRDSKLMRKIWSKIDLLKSLRSKGKILKIQGRKKILRLHQKMKDMISDLHWKTANFLCNHFTDILLPDFATRKKDLTGETMMSRLHRTTNRTLDFLSHYQFKQRLLHVASQFTNCKVWTVGEAYTSKTCTNCGFLNQKSSSEVLTCKSCLYRCDRDYIGARNIFLKNVDY